RVGEGGGPLPQLDPTDILALHRRSDVARRGSRQVVFLAGERSQTSAGTSADRLVLAREPDPDSSTQPSTNRTGDPSMRGNPSCVAVPGTHPRVLPDLLRGPLPTLLGVPPVLPELHVGLGDLYVVDTKCADHLPRPFGGGFFAVFLAVLGFGGAFFAANFALSASC